LSGYSKLFGAMWQGSLYGHFEASAVFMVLLSLCDAQGVVDRTPEAIAGTTGWPLEFICKGIEELGKPDPRSRTPDEEGRRIIPLDAHRNWGWRLTNYDHYRQEMRSIDRREYMRVAKRRERERTKADSPQESTPVNTSTSVNRRQPIAEAEAYAEAEAKNKSAPEGALLVLHSSLPTKEWDEWLTLRRKRRWPTDELTLRKQLAVLAPYDYLTQAEILNTSIQAGWQGLFASKTATGPPRKKYVPAPTVAELEAEEAARARSG
jgi:hypothetical protein